MCRSLSWGSVHATVTGMHLYEMRMDFIRSLPLFVCVAYSGWPEGIGSVTLAERRCVFFP